MIRNMPVHILSKPNQRTENSVKNKFFTGLAMQDVANIVPAQCGYNPHESLQVAERKELKFLGY